MWQIDPAADGKGYRYRAVPLAQLFLNRQAIPDRPHPDSDTVLPPVQQVLFSMFLNSAQTDQRQRAEAGLCLRCHVSTPILKSCQKIASFFSGQAPVTYRDLLPFVLNDDGKTLITLDQANKTQLVLDEQDQANPSAYTFFSIKILQSFKPQAQSSMSLENWAYLQTKQNPELKAFLSEFGFQGLSDWALLNRTRQTQLKDLSERDRHLVEVFHAVYRRDRRQQPRNGRCPTPSEPQLQEMLHLLQARLVFVEGAEQLMIELRQVATTLRQYDVWSTREPLEIYDLETQTYRLKTNLVDETVHELEIEKQELLEFLAQELKAALVEAIQQALHNRLTTLAKSKNYAGFAAQFIPGLQLYYEQGLSLREIVPYLKMTSWDQARRILHPGELLHQVRTLTIQQVLAKTLERATSLGLTTALPDPGYLKDLVEHIEAYADAEIFQKAVEELRTGKNRTMDSPYAQQLRLSLQSFGDPMSPI
jgi:hypothetical protein